MKFYFSYKMTELPQMPPFPFNTYRWATLSRYTVDPLINVKTNEIDIMQLLNYTLYETHDTAKYHVSPEDFIDWLESEKICKRNKEKQIVIIEDMQKFYSTFLKPSELRRMKIEEENKSDHYLYYDTLYNLTTKIRNNATFKHYPPYDKNAEDMLRLGEETNEMLDEMITNNKTYIRQAQERIDLVLKYYSQLYHDEDKYRARWNIHCWQRDIKRYQNKIEYYDSLKTE